MNKKQKKKRKHEIDWSTKPLHVEKSNSHITVLLPSNETMLKGEDYCAAMYHSAFLLNTNTELAVSYKEFCKSYTKDEIEECSAKLKNLLESTAADYLARIADIDPRINRYAYRNNIDSFDFRKYNAREHSDILHEMSGIINNNPDITLLFSPSEIFDIILTDAITLRVVRGQYSPEEHSIGYQIIEYTDFCLSDDTTINIPVMIQNIDIRISNILNGEYITNETASGLITNRLNAISIKGIQDEQEDSGNINICQMTNKGYCTVADMITAVDHGFLKMTNKNKTTASETLRIIHKIEYQNPDVTYKMPYPLDNQRELHMISSSALCMACIVIANNFLLQKKLSKPITKAVSDIAVNKQVEIILENRPDRKTRMLGACIEISTGKRPVVITEEKLIKYHTPEWMCKGHLRHLKNGRIIEVKPSVHKRRCVDMSNIIDNRPKQAVDYIITEEVQKHDLE